MRSNVGPGDTEPGATVALEEWTKTLKKQLGSPKSKVSKKQEDFLLLENRRPGIDSPLTQCPSTLNPKQHPLTQSAAEAGRTCWSSRDISRSHGAATSRPLRCPSDQPTFTRPEAEDSMTCLYVTQATGGTGLDDSR